MTTAQIVITIIMVAVGTLITRFLPFVLFGKRKNPFIDYLGKVLPFATIALLVLFSISELELLKYPYGIPEAISLICTALLHFWKRNTLLSIGGGTLICIILMNTVFA